ncbi:hypothetical protein [Natrinema halophilum]|uniref:Small CPxCG-related zinc finger protein n=1 Tax=Natrinema halophilum TaxID=1699371 RepID=A0A7D5GVF9_9EURY|nr:hypothetical protein [Natrinema halophilum]QLG50786.1 hypothetical protein HYG82_19055 [Natrinema halophilum]
MVESPDATEEPSLPTCPRCDAPVSQVTMRGPTEQIATPCGCSIAPGTLEHE